MLGTLTTANLVVNGSITGTGIGYDIGDIPGPLVSSGPGNLPMINPNNRLIFRRQNPTVGNSTDFQFDRDTTAAPAGTPGGINRIIGVNSTVGANNGESEVGILITMTSHSTSSVLNIAHYPLWIEAVRAAGAKGHLTGQVIDVSDSTNLGTAAAGVPNHLGFELNSSAAGLDDAAEAASFGGIGLRRLMALNAGKAPGSTQPVTTYAYGILIGVSDPSVSISSAIGFTATNGTSSPHIISALDTRGAVSPDANPVAAVRMSSDQVIDFKGGPALNSVPGNYMQYTTTGTPRLRYMVGATERFTLADTKPNVTGAKNANPALASLLTALVNCGLITDSTTA